MGPIGARKRSRLERAVVGTVTVNVCRLPLTGEGRLRKGAGGKGRRNSGTGNRTVSSVPASDCNHDGKARALPGGNDLARPASGDEDIVAPFTLKLHDLRAAGSVILDVHCRRQSTEGSWLEPNQNRALTARSQVRATLIASHKRRGAHIDALYTHGSSRDAQIDGSRRTLPIDDHVAKIQKRGETEMFGGAVPVPIKVTVCGLLGPLSLTDSTPERGPWPVGRKLMLIVQEASLDNEAPQLFVCIKSPLILNAVMESAVEV